MHLKVTPVATAQFEQMSPVPAKEDVSLLKMDQDARLNKFYEWKARFVWPFVGAKDKWYAEVSRKLVDSVQPGDEELFLGEEYGESEAYSTGACYRNFLRKHPEAATPDSIHGVERLAQLIKYAEDTFGGDFETDSAKWDYILREESMATLLSHFIEFESLEEIRDRIIRIKKKLKRMPMLDLISRRRIYIFCKDYDPGFFHPKDSAILGVIGILCGVVVLRLYDMQRAGEYVDNDE